MQNGIGQAPLITSMSTRVQVSVISSDDCEIAGYLYSPFYERYFRFSNALELLVRMNEMFDDLKFPQSSVEYRSFRNKRNRLDSGERDESLVSEVIQNENVQAKFVVHVQFRQNATWQGTIEWVEENKTQRFRSALEMLKLMEEALSTGKEIIMNSFLD